MVRYEVTERFVLHAGYSCNERCEFCYYLQDLIAGSTRDWSTEENKRRISVAAMYGKKAIDISGGEPTIRNDLTELIAFCVYKGFHTVNIITNGLKTAKQAYCKTLKEAGLTEGLFSLHSHDPEMHDSLTNVKGSHTKLIKSLENFAALGLQQRINTVITNENYNHINEFFKFIYPYNPAAVNLLVFNPSQTADKLPKHSRIRFSDYRLIGNAISDALDTWKDRLSMVNVRFLPFCFLKKHLDCIRTIGQKVHEDQEWDPFLHIAFEKGYHIAVAATIAGLFTKLNTPKYKTRNIQTIIGKHASVFRMKYYYRQDENCKACSLSPICPGVQRDFVAKFGFPDFEPFLLENKIYDPLYYVKGYKHVFKCLRKRT